MSWRWRAEERLLELSEWQPDAFAPAVSLSAKDELLATRLDQGPSDGRVAMRPAPEGVYVSARAGVGVISFSEFEVRIVPKIAGDHLSLVEMFEFASGIDALRRYPTVRRLEAQGGSLLDLIALLFVEGVTRLLRDGLLADYVEREEDLRVIRGRFLFDRQIRQRFGRIDLLACRFDEHEHDVVENRLIALALGLCASRATHETVKRRARQLQGLFDQVCDATAIDPSLLRDELAYNRLNAHYRPAHELAWLIIAGLGIEDVLRRDTTRSFAFTINMNDLFERFISRLVERLTAGSPYRIARQRKDRSILREVPDGPYRTVIPDLLITAPAVPAARLAVDAKYKLYDDGKVDMEDIYQTFLYAFAYKSEQTDTLPSAVIVHPSSHGPRDASRRFRVRSFEKTPRAEIRVIGVHIPTALRELRSAAGQGPETDGLLAALAELVPSQVAA